MLRALLLSSVMIAQVSVGSCLESFKLPTTPESSSSTTTVGAFGGSWASVAASTVQNTCTDFRWAATAVTSTGVSGTWSATCWQSVPVTGTASVAVTSSGFAWTAAGTGTAASVGTCAISLTGTASIDRDQIRIPYSGTTCLGPVSGTEILRKPQ
jgi:hypothetical protein